MKKSGFLLLFFLISCSDTISEKPTVKAIYNTKYAPVTETSITGTSCLNTASCKISLSRYKIFKKRGFRLFKNMKIPANLTMNFATSDQFGSFILPSGLKNVLKTELQNGNILIKSDKTCIGAVLQTPVLPSFCDQSEFLSLDLENLKNRDLKKVLNELVSVKTLFLTVKTSQIPLLENQKNKIKGLYIKDSFNNFNLLTNFGNLEYLHFFNISQQFTGTAKLPELKALSLTSQDSFPVTSCIKSLISDPGQLTELHTGKYTLPQDIENITQYKNLKILEIKHILIPGVEKDFHKLSNLTNIEEFHTDTDIISGKDLTNTLARWKKLKILELDFHNIEGIKTERFSKNLISLTLKGNLNKISIENIKNMNNLKSLELNQSRGGIPELKSGILPESLVSLSLSSVKAYKLPDHIKSLTFFGSYFPSDFIRNLEHLQYLYVYANAISEIVLPKYNNLTELKISSLDNTKIINFSESLSRNCRRISLNLKFLPYDLSEGLNNKPYLETISVLSPNLKTLPVLELPSLKQFYAGYSAVDKTEVEKFMKKSDLPELTEAGISYKTGYNSWFIFHSGTFEEIKNNFLTKL